jgi:ubiquinone/menaquinone biosynthesis C-methylase UbiE
VKEELYRTRPLLDGHPDLSRAVESFVETQDACSARVEITQWMVKYLSRLRPLPAGSDVCVVGCGPKPRSCTVLAEHGFNVAAVEPVAGFVESAQHYVGSAARVVRGSAEAMPLPDGSQDVVVCESILEHVDSPRQSLTEIYRTLRSGGVAWIVTTNRFRFSPTGRNDEYNVPFFNWFPPSVKEAFVYHHLHYRPGLANYSLRPAVHWFSYPDLCNAGRDAGFSRFYSLVDLASVDDPRLHGRPWRQWVLRTVRTRPVLRALALTQVGGTIAMVKA